MPSAGSRGSFFFVLFGLDIFLDVYISLGMGYEYYWRWDSRFLSYTYDTYQQKEYKQFWTCLKIKRGVDSPLILPPLYLVYRCINT